MKKYRESIYNFKEMENGRVVVYNSKTGGVVVPDSDHTTEFLSTLSNPNLKNSNDEMLKELLHYNFLVEFEKDEIGEIKELHELAIEEAKQHLGFIIVPTEYCNFACPYCFVYNYDRPPMSQKVFDGIYNAFVLKIEENKAKELKMKQEAESSQKPSEEIEKIIVPTRLDISWFGGEPTCASESIINFMDRALELENIYTNVHINSSMITNGYLLTYDLFKKFTDRKINFFQITLDGNKETHDQTRYLRGSKGPTFDVIYKNLLEIKKKVSPELKFSISIRSNFLKSNLSSMEKLKEKFTKDFGDDYRFSHYFHQVYESENKDEDLKNGIFEEHDGLDAACQLNNYYDNQKMERAPISELYSILPRPKYHPCFSTNNSYCVTVEGALFGCESMIGNDEKALGKLNEDGTMIFFEEPFKKWKDNMFNHLTMYRNCINCKLLPTCIGGCKYNKLEILMEGCLTNEKTTQKLLKEYLVHYIEKEKTTTEIILDGNKNCSKCDSQEGPC